MVSNTRDSAIFMELKSQLTDRRKASILLIHSGIKKNFEFLMLASGS